MNRQGSHSLSGPTDFLTPAARGNEGVRVHHESPEIRRSAVILHGLVQRSLRHAVKSLRENVIAPLARTGEVDVFFHSWDVREITNPRTGETGRVLDPGEVARWMPEAKGIFESQEEFDREVDWERMFERNPMRHCTDSEEAARATLMNFRRALESQERAWRFFEKTKTRDYARVVVTRADLRFLEELETSNIERPTSNVEVGRIWVPRFHSWGGVNDRFAVGGEKEMGIYCCRAAFADGWVLSGGQGNSEQILMKWLERNRIRTTPMDFTFQRVRANGEVAEMDRGLGETLNIHLRVATRGQVERPTSNIEVTDHDLRDGCSKEVNERFLILAREAGPAAESLRRVLEPLGKVEVIVDRPVSVGWECQTDDRAEVAGGAPFNGSSNASTVADRRYIHIPDEEVAGYEGLMGRISELRDLTAWTRALVHLERTLKEDEAVWFVEDDVAGDAKSFAKLVTSSVKAGADLSAWEVRTREEDGGWYFWQRADGFFSEPCRAFQPLCRLSARLLREVLEFRKKHGRFIFHEMLFASLAGINGMRCLDWSGNAECREWFSQFQDTPEVRPLEQGICHPVKHPLVHEAVCLYAESAACERASEYEGGARGWHQDDFGRWKRLFSTGEAVKVLETDTFDGVSANLLLDEIFPNPDSEVHHIGLYDGESGREAREKFERNAERGRHSSQLHIYEGTTREILAWMIAGDGFWESFDFIHLNGAADAPELLADACQAWSLLKTGGILILGNVDRGGGEQSSAVSRSGADAFLDVFSGRLARLFEGRRVAVMKRA